MLNMDPEQQEQYNITSVRQTLKKRWIKRYPPHQPIFIAKACCLLLAQKWAQGKQSKAGGHVCQGWWMEKEWKDEAWVRNRYWPFQKLLWILDPQKVGYVCAMALMDWLGLCATTWAKTLFLAIFSSFWTRQAPTSSCFIGMAMGSLCFTSGWKRAGTSGVQC